VAVQRKMTTRNAPLPEAERIVFRMGVNLGDVALVEGDIYGDGVNVAARLEQLCPPGGIMVSGPAYDQLQGKVDAPIDFVGDQQIKNIARPVRTYQVRLQGSRPPTRPSRALRTRFMMAAALLLLAILTGTGWWLWPEEHAIDKRGIAVLPFADLAGSESTSRLADGITEDIITDLSRFKDLDVIARNSTAVYKGKPTDVREVGKTLGVRYVLEGSIQREGDRARVTAQLIDAGNGAHVWSQRWDRPAQDLFCYPERNIRKRGRKAWRESQWRAPDLA
jgi:TolB-like protein